MTTRLEKIGNRLFGKVALNPGKNFLHSMLIEDIKKHSDEVEVAADISSSHFANTEYFRSDRYVGVDIDRTRLRKGKKEFEDEPGYAAVQADIRRPLFQPNSVGVIVSTHTLSHLDSDEHLSVVELFVKYLTPGGSLLIQAPDDSPKDEIEERLSETFETVERTDYLNAFSRLFIRRHTDEGSSYDPTMTGWQRYLNAATIVSLSFIERLGWPDPSFTYFKCINKRS